MKAPTMPRSPMTRELYGSPRQRDHQRQEEQGGVRSYELVEGEGGVDGEVQDGGPAGCDGLRPTGYAGLGELADAHQRDAGDDAQNNAGGVIDPVVIEGELQEEAYAEHQDDSASNGEPIAPQRLLPVYRQPGQPLVRAGRPSGRPVAPRYAGRRRGRAARPSRTRWLDRTRRPSRTHRPCRTRWLDRTRRLSRTRRPDRTRRLIRTQRPTRTHRPCRTRRLDRTRGFDGNVAALETIDLFLQPLQPSGRHVQLRAERRELGAERASIHVGGGGRKGLAAVDAVCVGSVVGSLATGADGLVHRLRSPAGQVTRLRSGCRRSVIIQHFGKSWLGLHPEPGSWSSCIGRTWPASLGRPAHRMRGARSIALREHGDHLRRWKIWGIIPVWKIQLQEFPWSARAASLT